MRINELMEVTVVAFPGNRFKARQRIDKRVGIIVNSKQKKLQTGQKWLVRVIAENPKATVYFLHAKEQIS